VNASGTNLDMVNTLRSIARSDSHAWRRRVRAARPGALALALLATATTEARAQSIGLPPVITRAVPLRPLGEKPFWINRADCLADDVLTFQASLSSSPQGAVLQVWAGAVDCSPREARVGSSPQCWLAYAVAPSPGTTAIDISVRARTLVGRAISADAVTPAIASADVCSQPSGSVPFDLYFLFVDANGNLQGAPAVSTNLGFDVTPPAPPTNVSAHASGDLLSVGWSPSPDSDVLEYRLSCADSTGAPGTTCPGGGLVPGDAPDPASACGTAMRADVAATVAKGASGTRNVAVAALDEVGNLGGLSNVACAPDPSADGGAHPTHAGADDSGVADAGPDADVHHVTIDGGGCSLAHGPATPARFPSTIGLVAVVVACLRRARATRRVRA
jgi:hypothetical protein